MIQKRSQGLFFKSLFQEKKGKPKRLVDSLDELARPDVRPCLLRVFCIRGCAACMLRCTQTILNTVAHVLWLPRT